MRTVRDWMTPTPEVVRLDTPIERCARILVHGQIRHLPVLDDEARLAGIVTDFDVFRHGTLLQTNDPLWVSFNADEEGLTAADIRTIQPLTAPPGAGLIETIEAQARHGSDATIVVDEDNRPVGVLTEHDVVRLAAAELPSSMMMGDRPRPLFRLDWRDPAIDAWRMMTEHGVRHVIVEDDGHIDGVLSWRDLIAEDVPAGRSMLAGDAVRGDTVHTINPGTPLRDAAAIMVERGIGCLPVLQDGQVIDVLTRADLTDAVITMAAAD